MADHPSNTRQQSKRILGIALLITAVVALGGAFGMRALFRSLQAPAHPTAAVPSDALIVGIGRTPGGAAEWIAYAAAFGELQKALDRKVILRYASSFAEIQQLVANAEVDIAMVPIFVYLNLERDDKAELVAAPVIRGVPGTTALIVVDPKSEANRLEDLRGSTIALTLNSVAGWPYLTWLLRDSGESPSLFFSELPEMASQELQLAAVAAGEVDAAAVSREVLAAWSPGSFRVIVESPSLGMPPVVARAGLDPVLRERIKAVLCSQRVINALPPESAVTHFTEVDVTDYAFSRDLALIAPSEGAASNEKAQ